MSAESAQSFIVVHSNYHRDYLAGYDAGQKKTEADNQIELLEQSVEDFADPGEAHAIDVPEWVHQGAGLSTAEDYPPPDDRDPRYYGSSLALIVVAALASMLTTLAVLLYLL